MLLFEFMLEVLIDRLLLKLEGNEIFKFFNIKFVLFVFIIGVGSGVGVGVGVEVWFNLFLNLFILFEFLGLLRVLSLEFVVFEGLVLFDVWFFIEG